MKRLLWFLIVGIFLVSCRKFPSDLPDIRSSAGTSAKPDTIPDKAALKIKLVKDGANYDETSLIFNHSAKPIYAINEDAAYMTGFGQVSLSSISSDGRDLAINKLPYSPGMSVGLDVHTKSDGPYFLMIDYENKIPAGIQVLVKDTYLKDSVDLNIGNYYFNVIKTDTNTFGNKRFKLILKQRKQVTTLPN